MKQTTYLMIGRICMFILMTAIAHAASAQDYVLAVGETGTVKTPKLSSGLYFENFTGLGTSSTEYIEVLNTTTFRVKKYFSGTVTVTSYYTYYYYVKHYNPVTKTTTDLKHGANGTAIYYVKCSGTGNNITISTPKSTIACGETVQLKYSFAQSYSGTPNVHYTTSDNCVSVSSSGEVTGLSPGKAKITATSDISANESSVTITVKEETPTGVEITPKETTIYLDESQQLDFEVKPFGTLQTVTWSVESGKSHLMSVSAEGVVTVIAAGQGNVIATTKNGKTDKCLVTIKEPQVLASSTYPENNAKGVSVFDSPSIIYSHAVQQGDNFASINLKGSDGVAVAGTASIDNNKVIFKPDKALKPLTTYTLTIPAGALRSKWGTQITETGTMSFTTRQLEKLTLTAPSNEPYYNVGEALTLTCSNPKARIYYTMNGATPGTQSTRYVQPIEIRRNFTLKAVAILDGYENSDILEVSYRISSSGVVSRFPNIESLYTYRDVNPNVRFANRIKASKHIEDITITNSFGLATPHEVIVADSSVYMVPKQALASGDTYTVKIPADAVVTVDGESNREYEWSFTTGDYATAISMGGYELGAAVKMDGSLLTWGNLFAEGNVSDGSATFVSQTTPETFLDKNVKKVSSGFTHHAAIMIDGSLWMWGRQYCGEFGNNSTTGSAVPTKVFDDVYDVSAGGQTTAILTDDHTLWMCGRNDFGQIGDSTTTVCRKPVKVMNDVKMAVAGWCSTFAIDAEANLWAWGRNDNHQLGDGTYTMRLKPTLIMTDVDIVAASAFESGIFAAIKTDGTLWIWGGDNAEPVKLANSVHAVAAGADYIMYIDDNNRLMAYGHNAYGQLGTNDTRDYSKPVSVLDNVQDVVSGGQTTLALRTDGSVWAWGRNYAGTLGIDNPEPSLTAYITRPERIVEGNDIGILEGIVCRKDVAVVEGNLSVVEMYPEPLNGEYTELCWRSTNPYVADVDDRGVITAESRGRTEIECTITGADGRKYTAVCHVLVGTQQEVDEANVVPAVIQTINLEKGWNWISLNVDPGVGCDIATVLGNANWSTGDYIKSNAEMRFNEYSSTDGWKIIGAAALQTIGYDYMYHVKSGKSAKIDIIGTPATALSMALSSGWNWISYPRQQVADINTALSNYPAMNGDIIKSIDSEAMFMNGVWHGTLTHLEPGKGYMLYRQEDQTEPLRIVECNGPSRADDTPVVLSTSNNQYAGNMTVIARIANADNLEGCSLVATAGGENRGIVGYMANPIDNTNMFMLTISGDKDDEIDLTLIDANGNVYGRAASVFTYTTDTHIGTFADPLLVELRTKELQIYPSPFNNVMHVFYQASDADAEVDILITDVTGRVIDRITDCCKHGTVDLTWRKGADIPQGVYMVTIIENDNISETVKVFKK